MGEIDPLLVERARAAPEAVLAVIVSLRGPVTDEALAAAGLAIGHRLKAAAMVTGTVRGAELGRLAALPAVLRIEADAPMGTLDRRDPGSAAEE